jgi:hypothetical protein
VPDFIRVCTMKIEPKVRTEYISAYIGQPGLVRLSRAGTVLKKLCSVALVDFSCYFGGLTKMSSGLWRR